MNINKSKELEKFFTQPSTALFCYDEAKNIIENITKKETNDLLFIEPSAGKGAFYDIVITDNKCIGIDIDSDRKDFIAADFLTWNLNKNVDRDDVIVIGNPPFGKRGYKAVQFFNKASEFASTIAFILPVIFRKHAIHKKLHKDFEWVFTYQIPGNSFIKDNKVCNINAEFQIWTRLDHNYKNKRLFSPPNTSHKEF